MRRCGCVPRGRKCARAGPAADGPRTSRRPHAPGVLRGERLLDGLGRRIAGGQGLRDEAPLIGELLERDCSKWRGSTRSDLFRNRSMPDRHLSRSRTITSLWLEWTPGGVVNLPAPPARVQEACGNVAGFLRLARSVRWVRPARRTVPPRGRPGRRRSHQAPGRS